MEEVTQTQELSWLIYDDCDGNTQFLRDHLLKIPLSHQLHVPNFSSNVMIEKTQEILSLIQDGKGTGVLCFNYSLNKNPGDIFSLVHQLNPKIVIMLGDCEGEQPLYNNLALFVPLFVRQYNHKFHRMFIYDTNNVIILPNFSKHVLIDDDANKGKEEDTTSTSRHLAWTTQFISVDNQMENRDLSLGLFVSVIRPYLLLQPGEETNKYKETVFVPCRRESGRLDVSQIYDACALGAIPVVVGNEEEIVNNFTYLNNPPFLFASTWEEAVTKMKDLLTPERAADLQSGHEQIQQWWSSLITSYREVFQKILKN